MKFYLRRVLILAAAVLMFIPLTAEAQKKKIPVKKSVSESTKPVENKAASKSEPGHQLSTLELALVEEINLARREPQTFVGFLNEYRRATTGTVISLPNRIAWQTNEGAPAIDEAIGEMQTVSNLKPLEIADQLSAAASMQLKDLQEDASLGHLGKNGSTLKVRLAQFGVVGKSSENICHRAKTAREVVMIFIIDDGVKSRMHRKNVLNPAYKKIGVACGSGKDQESLCVAVFAENLKDTKAVSGVIEF